MKISKNTPISELELSVRANNYLHNFNVSTLGELTALTSLEHPYIILCHSKAEVEITRCLENLGLKLGMTDIDWVLFEEKINEQS